MQPKETPQQDTLIKTAERIMSVHSPSPEQSQQWTSSEWQWTVCPLACQYWIEPSTKDPLLVPVSKRRMDCDGWCIRLIFGTQRRRRERVGPSISGLCVPHTISKFPVFCVPCSRRSQHMLHTAPQNSPTKTVPENKNSPKGKTTLLVELPLVACRFTPLHLSHNCIVSLSVPKLTGIL
jgi:hypothetical protein